MTRHATYQQPERMAIALGQPLPAAGIFSYILCGIDGTRSAYEAVRQAAALAAPGGHLTLLAATDVRGSEPFATALLAPAVARRALDHARRLAKHAGVSSERQVAATGRAHEVLLSEARQHSLLALGAPAMSRLAQLLVGGIATEAAHALPCALLIARRPPPGQRFAERIMIASDASDHSDALVDLAAELAVTRGASLVLFHAPHAESSSHPTRIVAQAERVRGALGNRGTVCVEPGAPHKAIVAAAARERVSLLLVASRHVSGVRALGSVSERLVHDAPCSLLVLRPDDLGAERSY